MYYKLYPDADATISSKYPTYNSGLDKILELKKTDSAIGYSYEGEWISGSTYAKNDYVKYNNVLYVCDSNAGTTQFVTGGDWSVFDSSSLFANSRILLKFDLNKVPETILSSSSAVTLKLFSSDIDYVSDSFTVNAHPVSYNWELGTGIVIEQENTIGVTWINKSTNSAWLSPGSDYLQVSSSVVFDSDTIDLEIDVKNIVDSWRNSTYENYGFLIKKSFDDEYNRKSITNISFYSRETNTVYLPELEFSYDDHIYSTGSISGSKFTNEPISVVSKNMQKEYLYDTKHRFYASVKPRSAAKTFVEDVVPTQTNYIDGQLFYSIVDNLSNRIMIPFSTGSIVSLNSTNGYYFDVYLSGFMPNRFYKILFKSVVNGVETYHDNDNIFKVIKW